MDPIPDLPDTVLDFSMSLVKFGNIYRGGDWWDVNKTIERIKGMFSSIKDEDFFVWHGDMSEWRGQYYIIIVLPKKPTYDICMFLINLRLYMRHPNPDNAMLYKRTFRVRVYTKKNMLDWIRQDPKLFPRFGRCLCTMYARAQKEDAEKVTWN